MTLGGWVFDIVPDARSIDIVDAEGGRLATLTFAVPGEPVAGWAADDEDLVLAASGDVVSRVRVTRTSVGLAVHLTVDSQRDQAVELPYLGLGLTLHGDASGWCWSSDLDAVVALTRPTGGGVLIKLLSGFLRPARDVPVFATGAPADESGRRAFHLAPPGAVLGPHKRHAVSLEVRPVGSVSDAVADVPAWLPPTVVPDGTPVELSLPDRAVVPGDGVQLTTCDTDVSLLGPPGHRGAAIHGPRGVHRLRLTWAPEVALLVASIVDELVRRRPSRSSDAAGFLVAESVARGLAPDADVALDWLDHVDWLDRNSLLADATAGVVAGLQREGTQLASAWRLLGERDVSPGYGLVVMRVWLASLALGGESGTLAHQLLSRPAVDGAADLELALLGRRSPEGLDAALRSLVDQLGGPLPGSPLTLSARDAAVAISLLRLCPETWPWRQEATEAASKAERLLLADHAAGPDGTRPTLPLDGLAWLLLGQLGI